MKEALLSKKLKFDRKYVDLEGRRKLFKITGLKKGNILDVGIGDCGCMSLFLAQRGFDVTGIDNSTWAVHKSREEAGRVAVKGSFKAKRANAESIPYEDNRFDAVFSYHSLHHMKDVEKAIHEMVRVCRIGGLVVISDLHAEGRKEYEHLPDGEFLGRMVRTLKKKTEIIQTVKTRFNMMYVCRKVHAG